MPLELADNSENDICGLLHARWIRAEASAPLVIMIHGRAGTARVVSAFCGCLPERTNILAPQATLPDLGGYSWWDVSERFNPELVKSASERVLKFIFSTCQHYELTPRSIFLLGFSQGAALGAALLQIRPDLFSGLALLAGFAPELVSTDPALLAHKKVFIAHGTNDTVIPLELAQRSAQFFESSGADLVFHQDPVEHKVGSAGMRQLKAWAQNISSRANLSRGREGMKKTILILILLTTQIALAEPPLKIGIISSLSGGAARWNKFQNMGITLAQEELAKNDYPIQLVFEDSATNATKAIAAYNKLFELDQVDAIIADDFGFAVAPLLPLLNRQKKFLLSISLAEERYCNQAPGYFYSVASQLAKTSNAFNQFFELNPQVQKIAMFVYDDPEWGNTYQKIWTSIAKSRGIQIVGTFLSSDLTQDFKSPLTQILQKKPDAIFLAHEPESFVKTAAQLGYQGLIVSANNIFEMLADSPEPREELEGVYVVDPLISPEFRAKFTDRFKRQPILEAYAGYEALQAVAKAFKNNQKKPEVGMRSVSYAGVAGKIDFTGKSCAGNQAQWGLFQFEKGEILEKYSPMLARTKAGQVSN